MDRYKLVQLLKQDEGPKLDFKEKIDIDTESGKKELAKDIIALANSPGGRGYLVIGVQDKTKRIVGLYERKYKEETIQQIISLRSDPPLTLRVEYVDMPEGMVCVITVFRSLKKPHQMRQTGAFYLRRGSTTDFATRDEIAAMLQYSGIVSNEQLPLFNMSPEVYDMDLIEDYLDKISLHGQSQNKPLLNNLGILHYDRESAEYYPTIGGMLLFCMLPQQYLPHTCIKVSNKLHKRVETRYFKGHLFDMIDALMVYIKDLPYTYPIEAIEECIINALIHRDYFDASRDIAVNLSWSKVVISNPGAIFGNETVNTIGREENPRRRNNWLYHAFLIMDDQKRLLRVSNGLSYIKRSFKDQGHVRIINVKKENLFKVILPGYSIFRKVEYKHE